MLSPQSELLIRNKSIFTEGRWAFINPSDCNLFSELDCPSSTVFHQFYDGYQRGLTQAPNVEHSFCAHPRCDQGFDGVVIYLPKSKQHFADLLENACELTHDHSNILVVGENRGGIKSAAKVMEFELIDVRKLDTARHCGLLSGRPSRTMPPNDEVASLKYTIDVAGINLDVHSFPGVFGFKQLDAGTELLLATLKKNLVDLQSLRRTLDFACGTGVVGAYFNAINIAADVTYVDISAMALEATKRTLASNKLAGTIMPHDGIPKMERSFQLIISNPPFHEGLDTNTGLSERFVDEAYQALAFNGLFYFVANNHLPYPKLLAQTFNRFEVVAKNQNFSVYKAKKLRNSRTN